MKNAIHAIVECRLTSKDFMKFQFNENNNSDADDNGNDDGMMTKCKCLLTCQQ